MSRRALELREAIARRDDAASRIDVAATMELLARLHRAQGGYEAARTAYERALAVQVQLLGASHVATAATLHGLGQLDYLQARFADAGERLQRALAIRVEQLGETHLDVAASLHHLGRVHALRAEWTLAQGFYERALATCERVQAARTSPAPRRFTGSASSISTWATSSRRHGCCQRRSRSTGKPAALRGARRRPRWPVRRLAACVGSSRQRRGRGSSRRDCGGMTKMSEEHSEVI